MQQSLYKSAFTLVELIVVITILAILGTIGFVSLQGYSVNARDSVRISDTKTFLKALNIYQTKNGEVPLPDDMTTITGSGVVFSYQGSLSGSVITELGQGQVPVDPLLGTPYLYATNEGRTKVQLLSYHEKNISSFELQNTLTYAETTYADMFPKVMGDEIGILLDLNNTPIASGSLDLLSYGAELQFIVSDSDRRSASGSELVKINPISSCTRQQKLGTLQNSSITQIFHNKTAKNIYCDLEHGTYMLADTFLNQGAPEYFGNFESESELDFLTPYKSLEQSISSDSIVGESSLYIQTNSEQTNGNYGGLGITNIYDFELGKTYTVEYYAKNLSASPLSLWFSHHSGGISSCLSVGVHLEANSDWQKVTKTCDANIIPHALFIWNYTTPLGEFLIDGFQIYEGESIEQ